MTLNLTKAEFATLKAVLGQLTGDEVKHLIGEAASQDYARPYNTNIELANWDCVDGIWDKMRKIDGTENI